MALGREGGIASETEEGPGQGRQDSGMGVNVDAEERLGLRPDLL